MFILLAWKCSYNLQITFHLNAFVCKFHYAETITWTITHSHHPLPIQSPSPSPAPMIQTIPSNPLDLPTFPFNVVNSSKGSGKLNKTKNHRIYRIFFLRDRIYRICRVVVLIVEWLTITGLVSALWWLIMREYAWASAQRSHFAAQEINT